MTKHVSSKSVPLEIMKFNMASPALIEASAGTGKTYTITNLVVRSLLGLGSKEVALSRPLQIEELLVVTFTNAATSDLKNRIFERIRAARGAFEIFIDNSLALLNEALLKNDDALVASYYLQKQQEQDDGVKDLKKVRSALTNGRKRAKVRKAALTIEGRIDESGNVESLNEPMLNDDFDELQIKVSDYTEDELQHLLLNINVQEVMRDSDVDPVFYEMISDLLLRKIVPLRQAILLLAQAERKINNAAICTIHSFCNSTLTQLYALESGEAFNTELKTDLSFEEKEAALNVWRRLFYKQKCSQILIDHLSVYSPQKLIQIRNELNKARHSDASTLFAGYYFEGFDELMEQIGCPIDINSVVSLERQLVAWLDEGQRFLDSTISDITLNILKEAEHLITTLPQKEFEGLYNPKTKTKGYLVDDPKKNLAKEAPAALDLILEIYRSESEIKAVLANQAASSGEADTILAKFLNKKILGTWRSKKFVAYGCTSVKPIEDKLHAFVNAILDPATELEELKNGFRQVLLVLVAIIMQQEFEKLCKEGNVMGNDDVLKRLDYALNNRGSAGERLAELIRKRYPLAMIDEFQDTDPVQFNIFSAIYLKQEALDAQAYCYLIGDPKQSIYAFRGSDINSYLKARQKIIELTHGKGLYTLDTNYRSQPDIVEAANAIFSTELNESNISPFEEPDIPFESVKSGIAKGLIAKQRKKKAKGSKAKDDSKDEDATFNSRSFILKELNEITLDGYEVPSESNNEGVVYHGAANTYVVSLNKEGTGNKTDATELYAQAAAVMIQRILSDGYFVRKDASGNMVHERVKASEIAVLVRKVKESDELQEQLRKLQIQSVYFSDRSSVLANEVKSYKGDQSEIVATPESNDILALMEAMANSIDRRAVYKVLASGLLCLSAQEYSLLINSDDIFEYEVKLLNDCNKVWKRYGFMPAFLKWANDPRHCMSSRLLSVHGGERLYTNYCHISEIVQSIHKKNTAIATQIHWFKEAISQNSEDLEDTKKRLESEQDQVKIITVHKSKGLEFPIVLMPFLWLYASDKNQSKDNIQAVQYYSNETQHRVLSFKENESMPVLTRVPMVDEQGQFNGDYVDHTTESSPRELNKAEEQKENTRLLYVAITRACHVNIFFVQNYKVNSKSIASSLMRLQGSHERLGSVALPDGEITSKPSSVKYEAECFLQEALKKAEKFTIIDGDRLLDPNSKGKEIYQEQESDQRILDADSQRRLELFNTYGYKSEDGFNDRSLNISTIGKNAKVPNVALSFIYKKAIDTTFNIFSYSSLTAAHDSAKASRHNYSLGRDDNQDDMLNAGNETQEQLSELPICVSLNDKALAPKIALQESTLYVDKDNCSVSALVQQYRERNINSLMIHKRIDMSPPVCHIFPRGTVPGSFMHEILEQIDFEKIKMHGYDAYLLEDVMLKVSQTGRFYNFMTDFQSGTNETYKQSVAEWFNDVLEAPLIAGKYHCFALADLEPMGYEREMEFLMSNARFNTKQLDALCAEVARRILPPHLSYLGDNLTLSYTEVVGFVTGSIDLACRFDLNKRLALHERSDLMFAIPLDDAFVIAKNMEVLRGEYKIGKLGNTLDPEINGDFVPPRFYKSSMVDVYDRQKNLVKAVESDYKYYVIDYKSNSMIRGSDELNVSEYMKEKDFSSYYEKYDHENILKSIYEHRYDVQFMLYSLALYRHLKLRLAVPLDASYEDLEAFYNKNIGGVMYLYLRGMKANYLRDKVSTGVFSTRLDFDIIYKLDQIFTVYQTHGDEE